MGEFSNMNQEITVLRRDCDAFLIPSGAKLRLQSGTEVMITQALGGSYTVNVYGNLARIDGKDGDALGKPVLAAEETLPEGTSLEEAVWAKLKTCYDPEIPINIVDLGLIYECNITPLGDNKYRIDIRMTLTAPGCGMGTVMANDVKEKLTSIPGITEVNVDVVFDPPWDQGRISDAAKLQLGIL